MERRPSIVKTLAHLYASRTSSERSKMRSVPPAPPHTKPFEKAMSESMLSPSLGELASTMRNSKPSKRRSSPESVATTTRSSGSQQWQR